MYVSANEKAVSLNLHRYTPAQTTEMPSTLTTTKTTTTRRGCTS
jgi:hypothetical protein